jgi:hypothetical protein
MMELPLSTVLIDQRLYIYGLDVCTRLRYPSTSAFAAKVPLECTRAVRLADMHEPSLWIDLPGLFLLFQWSSHPLAGRFGTWMALQRSAFLAAVPACLLSEGLWLLRAAVGPRAQILAELSGTSAHGYPWEQRRVLSPPRTYDLARLVVSCLKSEVAFTPTPAVRVPGR